MRQTHHRTTKGMTGRRGRYSRTALALSVGWLALGLSAPCAADSAAVIPSITVADSAAAPVPDLADILARYNAVIVRERAAVESLRVVQTMIEPQEDGSSKTSEAVLVYTTADGMDRREVFCEITHPAGDYTLDSLIGPALRPEEYDLRYAGSDTVAGEEAYHISVTAIVRDRRHFDGDVWISTRDLAPMRVTGEVADPPFPVVLITLDKSFESGPGGLRLLRRHSGEVEINLLLGTKRGLRHIFYDDYRVSTRDVD